MLRKTTTGFRGPSGAEVHILAIANNNGGTESAVFEYREVDLNTELILGHPGCRFTIAGGREVFEVGVVFDPAQAGASYDLFEEEGGVQLPLDRSITAASGEITQSFVIEGVAAPVREAVVEAPPRKAAAKKKRAAPQKVAVAKKKAKPKKGPKK